MQLIKTFQSSQMLFFFNITTRLHYIHDWKIIVLAIFHLNKTTFNFLLDLYAIFQDVASCSFLQHNLDKRSVAHRQERIDHLSFKWKSVTTLQQISLLRSFNQTLRQGKKHHVFIEIIESK